MTSQIDRLRVAAVLLALAAGVVACSNDTDDALDRSPEPTVTLRTDPPPTTTTTTPPTTTSPPTTTTLHEPAPPDLPPCTTNMGTTLREDLPWVGPGPEHPMAPDDWEPPPQEGFDWDQDGQPDTLTIGEPDGTVTLTWATGSLTITGITTRFDQPLVDGLGVTHDARPPHLLDGIKPAYVADVTGDGWLDLLLIDQGTVSILAGAGDQTPTGTLPFESIGTDTLGWTNPPVTAPWPQHPNQEPQFDRSLPEPHSSISAAGDVSSDGVEDIRVDARWERSQGPFVFYDGISCRAR